MNKKCILPQSTSWLVENTFVCVIFYSWTWKDYEKGKVKVMHLCNWKFMNYLTYNEIKKLCTILIKLIYNFALSSLRKIYLLIVQLSYFRWSLFVTQYNTTLRLFKNLCDIFVIQFICITNYQDQMITSYHSRYLKLLFVCVLRLASYAWFVPHRQ